MGEKPTIADLEAILNDPTPHEIHMLPDGQIRARPVVLTDGSVYLQRIEQLENALSWVLPMAKGYAAAHPVGDNAGKIAAAEAILHPPILEDD